MKGYEAHFCTRAFNDFGRKYESFCKNITYKFSEMIFFKTNYKEFRSFIIGSTADCYS